MSARRHHRLGRAAIVAAVTLLSANVALVLALWGVWQLPISTPGRSPSPMTLPEMAVDLPGSSSDGSQTEDILNRPVFAASRRPFVPPPPPPPVLQPVVAQPISQPTPDLIVDGILLNGRVRKAHLRKRSEASGDWQAEGDILDGWTVTTISNAKVVLTREKQAIEVELYPQGQVP